MRTNALHQSNF